MRKIVNFKSWQSTIMAVLTLVIVCSTVTIFTTSYYYLEQVRNAYITSNNYECEKWVGSIDTRLNIIAEQVYDILVTLYNNKEYSKSVYDIDAFTSSKIIDLLANKTLINNDISAIFFYDANSKHYIYYANHKWKLANDSVIKTELGEICRKNYGPQSERSWSIKKINNIDVFYKAMKMGRFVVGVISQCDFYTYENDGTVKISSFIIDDDMIVVCEDKNNFISLVNTRKLGTENSRNKAIAYAQGTTSKIKGAIVSTHEVSSEIVIGLAFVINSCVSVILLIALFRIMKTRIVKPTNELIVATNQVSNGNIDYLMDLDSAGSQEFEEIYDHFNKMTKQIGDLKIQSYEMKLSDQQNRLRMLRAQVKPHTFLNGITTISNLTYSDNQEIVREYIYAFSQFTRYMLHTDSEWVSIEEELGHINTYVKMQKMRFPNSLEFTNDIDEGVLKEKVPFLLMYSLVENSCKHAMNMIEPLNIKLSIHYYEEDGFKGIRIVEEDDGDGFPEDVLINFNNNAINTKEHLGLTNTRYTLNLLYHRDDLLRLSNKQSGGAQVELLIPQKEEKQ